MTATNGIFNEETGKYIDAWAEMMLNIWREKMDLRGVGSSKYATGNLRNSLTKGLNRTRDKITFTFERYGYYVEAGIGPEFGKKGKLGGTRNILGQFAEDPKRMPKPWFAGSYWYSKTKLKIKMLEMTGGYYLRSVSDILNGKK
jgi:hypothetical protein